MPKVNLNKKSKEEKKELEKVLKKVLSSGEYVGGQYIKDFENKISKFCNVKYCVSLNSGTDALTLGLHALGVRKGDEVITTSNSFIASTSVIVHLGAKPVFVDVLKDQCMNPDLIESKITKKTKVIMPVHLTGRMCDMHKIKKIAKKYKLKIIEDAAQSIGSRYGGIMSGAWGDIGCFSAHPLKNLNAMGDSGYLTTNSKQIYKYISDLKNHGMTNRNIVRNFGYVSRMDNLQAAILNFRFSKLKKVIKIRRENASLYRQFIQSKKVFIPENKFEEFNTFHTFVIQVPKRNELRKYLKKNKVETSIHYPRPIHLQPAAKFLNYKRGDFPATEKQSKRILTLPINQYIKIDQIKYISKLINNFYEK